MDASTGSPSALLHKSVDFDDLIKKFEDDYYGLSNNSCVSRETARQNLSSSHALAAKGFDSIQLVIPSPVSLKDQSLCSEMTWNTTPSDSSPCPSE